MPENASTRTTDRDRLRSRLVSPRSAGRGATAGAPPAGAAPHVAAARGKPAQVEQSPVLFRLPAIAPVELRDAELDDIAAASQPPHIQPPHSLRGDDEVTLDIADSEPRASFHASGQPSHSQSVLNQSALNQTALNQTQSSQTALNQPQSSQSPLSQSQSGQRNAADDVASRLQLSGAADILQIESAPAAEAVAGVEANSEPMRTWWEHWSSGVVLILLVIALVVASIIAFNDSSNVSPEQLAGQLDGLTLDEFDLSSIAIPDISMPPLSGSADRPLSSVTPSAAIAADAASSVVAAPIAAPAASDSASVALAAADKAASEQAAAEQAIAQPTANQTQAAGNLASPLPAVASGAVPVSLADQAAAEVATQPTANSTLPLPLATLDRPTEVAAPRLFPATELSGGAAQTPTGGLGISSLPVSNPTVSLEQPGTEGVPAEGTSPTFYDGASRAGEQQTVSGSSMSAAADGLSATASKAAYAPQSQASITSAAGPVDTNMPRISAVLASATTSSSSGAAPAGQVVASATPDFNGESIIEAYLQFKKLNQAASGPASNRYPDPPPAN